ncbi:hypothetical protein HRbin41_01347 [bacterium HR41]|nr:hypothetical protein HRbin41_01347 [bacterium HR41]
MSSGWKAIATVAPWRTATGWPLTLASTSTPVPTSSTHGARMNTARRGPPASPRTGSSHSKDATWRPKALRRQRMSRTPRWSRSSTIIPAQVARQGSPAASSSRNGSASRSRSMPIVIVVDSPPGSTSASTPSRSREVRTRRVSAPARSSIRWWASKSPWIASTPTSGRRSEAASPTTTRAAGAGCRKPPARRSRSPSSPRRDRATHRRSARGRRSEWWPQRSPAPAARDPRT